MKENWQLTNGMIDSHLHMLEIRKKKLDPSDILDECFKNGLAAGMDIGIHPDDYESRKAIAGRFPDLFLTAGIHPGAAREPDQVEENLSKLEEVLQAEPVAAVGETGLDWFRNHGTPETQKTLFIEQIKLANRYDLPVIIHNREADEDVLQIVKEQNPRKGGIMHCFSSGPETAKKAIEAGFYISFAGNITYKKTEAIQKAAAQIPIERLLIETDAPYLSPQKVRGKPNHSGFIGYTYEYIAEIRSINLFDLIENVQKNFFIFLNENREWNLPGPVNLGKPKIPSGKWRDVIPDGGS